MIPFTPTTAIPTVAPCPSNPDWVYSHPYCYFVSGAIGTPVRTWADANSYCMSQGGYLASIHSSTEQKFINTIVSILSILSKKIKVGIGSPFDTCVMLSVAAILIFISGG